MSTLPLAFLLGITISFSDLLRSSFLKTSFTKSIFFGIAFSIFFYFFIDNNWWIFVYEGNVVVDVFPE